MIGDVAAARNVAMFVCSSSSDLEHAEPVGVLTAKDRETLHPCLAGRWDGYRVGPCRTGQYRENGSRNRLVSLQKRATYSVWSSRIRPAIFSSTLARYI